MRSGGARRLVDRLVGLAIPPGVLNGHRWSPLDLVVCMCPGGFWSPRGELRDEDSLDSRLGQ